MAPDATKTVGKGGLRKQQPLLPHTHAQAAQTAAGQPEIKSQTLADIGAAGRLICASRLPWAWRPPPPISAALGASCHT